MPDITPSQDHTQSAGWRVTVGRILDWMKLCEDWLLCLALAAMALLPVVGIVLRRFHTGIEGTGAFITHLTLVVGMLGGALAARERKLLSLSVAENMLHGRAKTIVRVIANGVGAAVTFWLMMASYGFVQTTPADQVLAQGIPVWVVQMLMPIGFGLILSRILLKSAELWRWRAVAAAIGIVLIAIFVYAWIDPEEPPKWLKWVSQDTLNQWVKLEPENMLVPGLVIIVLATLLGLPIFAMLGGFALLLFFVQDYDLATSVAVDHYRVVKDESFPALPLFTLAGFFLAEARASHRLIRVFQALFGGLRGGPAVVTVVVCAFFTSFTGASGVTILALAALLMPVLIDSGYQEKTALGLLTGAGSLGMLFPPCLPVILYAIIAEQDIERMFLGGLLPGLLLVSVTGVYGVWKAKSVQVKDDAKYGQRGLIAYLIALVWEVSIPAVFLLQLAFAGKLEQMGLATGPTDALRNTGIFLMGIEIIVYWRLRSRILNWLEQRGMFIEAWEAVCACRWELRIPMVALIGIFSGWATPVEAAAVTAVYTFVVETFVYRDLRLFRDVPRVMAKCGLLVGGVLLILGVAMGFTNYLIDAMIPSQVVDWVRSGIESKWVFLLCLNGILIIVGCLMDVFSAIIVMVPLIVPLGKAFGVDPVHLGIIFLANLELGYITPPIGMNLFLSALRFNKPMIQVCRAIIPILLVQIFGVLVITYIPAMTTWLPRLLLGS